MASQTTPEFGARIGSESQDDRSIVPVKLHGEAAGLLLSSLTIARILFASVLLNSIIDWNDIRWTETHFLALIPFIWAVVAVILWVLGKFRWKTGGRLLTLTDLAICAGTIIFFPPYILSALALAFLSGTFLMLRHDGRFAAFSATLPLGAMLVQPLRNTIMPDLYWPGSYQNMGVGGEIVTFLLASLVVIFSVLMVVRVRLLEQPLTFHQPWEEEFSSAIGRHNIEPIISRLNRLYPSSKLICILDSRKSSEGVSIVTSSDFIPQDVEPLQSQLTSAMDQYAEPTILLLDDQYSVDVATGAHEEIPSEYKNLTRGLTGLGFRDGILSDFRLGHMRGRLFFSSGTRVDEALRKDVAVLHEQIDSYFEIATKWELRRQEMIAVARDLARRDLHDGVLQSLAALKMRLVTVAARPSFSEHPDVDILRKTVDIITVEQARLRALLHNDEDAADAINLIEALEVCLQTLSLQWEITLKLKSSEPALPVDKESAENIEYLVREAIANAIRHAGASELTLSLALDKGDLMMTLKDDQAASKRKTNSRVAARAVLESRSLHQRLTLVNGRAYSEDMEDSTLLAISIPMDFTANA